MPIVLADRVLETSTTTGTGPLTLDGALAGYRRFQDALTVADQTYYALRSRANNAWEVGIGTLSAAAVLTRTTVLSSSNANAAVDLVAGGIDVWIDAAAALLQLIISGSNPGHTHTGYCASDDARLSNARTPTAHAASHASGQADVITPAAIAAAAAIHAANHGPTGSDPVSPENIGAIPNYHAANAITAFQIAGWDYSAAWIATNPIGTHNLETTNVHGLATTAGLVYTGDSRLYDARTPTAHAASHASGQADVITPAAIGAAASSHNHTGTYEASGSVATHAALTTGVHGLGTASQQDASYFALAGHTHTGVYAAADHNHTGTYEASGAVATHAALTTGVHGLGTASQQDAGYFALVGHTHTGVYAAADHNHTGTYEASGAVATHAALTTGVHGLGTASQQNVSYFALAAHAASHASGQADAIDHGGIAGLGDDDHTQYLLANGTRSITGKLTVAKAAESGVNEVMAEFSVDDNATAKLVIDNGSSTNGACIPRMSAYGSGTAAAFIFNGIAETDTGTGPVLTFNARPAAGGSIATRPCHSFRNGNVSVLDIVPGGVQITGTTRLGASATPASAGAAGVAGQFAWDASYLYICTAANTWRRVAHATW